MPIPNVQLGTQRSPLVLETVLTTLAAPIINGLFSALFPPSKPAAPEPEKQKPVPQPMPTLDLPPTTAYSALGVPPPAPMAPARRNEALDALRQRLGRGFLA